MKNLEFKTIGKAIKQTKLSYLGGVNVSQKIIKSQKVDKVLTYCLYLAPASESGHNVCSHSTAECRIGCLATSGRARMEFVTGATMIKDARINKTKLFYENQPFFMDWLFAELKAKENTAKSKGYGFAVRLNGTSDIDWANIIHNGKNVFDTFPNVNFYDYTKNPSKFFNKPKNYHLTLSYTGHNWETCKKMLKRGYNVAMVFNIANNKALPVNFDGYDVIDGDITDLRIKDKTGIIVGLHWKNIGDKKANEFVKNSIFCVQNNDTRNSYQNLSEAV